MAVVQDIVDKVRLDFPDRSETEVLSDLQDVYDNLAFEDRISTGTTSWTTTADDSTYALSASTARVHQVRYFEAAGDYSVLTPTHVDELDSRTPYWRNDESGTPEKFYIDGGTLVVHPAPVSTASGGYPKIEADVSLTATLELSTVLPVLVSYNVFTAGAKMLAALRTNDGRYEEYKSQFHEERNRLNRQVTVKAADFRPWIKVSGGSRRV